MKIEKYLFLCFMLILLPVLIYSQNQDHTTDKEMNEIKEKLTLKKNQNNLFFSIINDTQLSVNDDGSLMYNKPEDKIYPVDYLTLQVFYTFPVNQQFGLGPCLLNQNTFKLVHHSNDTDAQAVDLLFNSVILPGINFTFTPYSKKLGMPILLFSLEIGPGIELNNNIDDGDKLFIKTGGFSNQVLILPIMPIHLFIMDINSFAVMATNTPDGWYPGLRIRNYLLVKFAFFNFLAKDMNSGVRIKNTFSYILTGKPSLSDLTSQYTYSKLFTTLYFGKIKGIELHLGYGFEYITFARDPAFHLGHKIHSEISWKKGGFNIRFSHSLIFYEKLISDTLNDGLPVNQFQLYFAFEKSRFAF
ncbi:MAG: hypothetical protein MJB14_20110 [Spirochaetes bacterium]|nr:hypothetical protein [Spirochaetota bacterium]